jgi:glycosyltransferase involved in cell wall biosynthesis
MILLSSQEPQARNTVKKTRVLMIGPDVRIVGGISALLETIVPVLHRQVELSYLPTVVRRPVSESGRISIGNMARAVSQYVRFLHALAQFHPHIIHLHTSQGIAWIKDTFFIVIAKTCRCRVVLHMHGGNFNELYEKSTRLMQFYTRQVLSLADAVIEVSAERRRRLAQIVSIERVYAFRNCIDLDAIPLHPPNHSTNGAKALFLGVVGQSKGVFDLLEAMGRLKSGGCSLQLWIAGYEELEGDLARARTLLQELDLEDVCHVVGMVRGASKSQLLKDASLFTLPSYQEALPMAILEAMAACLPIVTTAVGGIPEIVQDGYNGFLVKPGDVKTLAEKLAILANDQHLREVMGRRSREIAQQELDVKPYVNRLVALYESIAGL